MLIARVWLISLRMEGGLWTGLSNHNPQDFHLKLSGLQVVVAEAAGALTSNGSVNQERFLNAGWELAQ